LRQATKEAEYRERVADLKARIDSYQERIAAEEGHCRSAKARRPPPARSPAHALAPAQLLLAVRAPPTPSPWYKGRWAACTAAAAEHGVRLGACQVAGASAAHRRSDRR